jgi:hypothetical protein
VARNPLQPCIIDECPKPAKPGARGWCSMHYMRWYRHGSPFGGGPYLYPQPSTCTVAGCTKRPRGHGLCDAPTELRVEPSA